MKIARTIHSAIVAFGWVLFFLGTAATWIVVKESINTYLGFSAVATKTLALLLAGALAILCCGAWLGTRRRPEN